MLTIQSIDEGNLASAVQLLAEGFPEQPPAFWDRGIDRLRAYCLDHGFPSIGSLLIANAMPVGVLLEIPSCHPTTGEKVLNLSSWYVKEKYRWFAPKMLSDATAAADVVYTDFTPSERAAELNTRLGFRTVSAPMMLFLLPLAAMASWGAGKVVSMDDIPYAALPQGEIKAVDAHRALGCLTFAIKNDERFHPVILDVIRKRNMPVARVLYAKNGQLIADNIGAIARFLLARGLPLLSAPIERDVAVKHAITWRPDYRYQIKGDWDDGIINELYSENVFLNA